MATPEGKIQKEILDALHKAGVLCWRNNNTATYDPKLDMYRAFNGMKGVPDILGCIDGRFIGVEVKTPRGKQSADQVLFQRRLESKGGIYILARSVDDIMCLVDKSALR